MKEAGNDPFRSFIIWVHAHSLTLSLILSFFLLLSQLLVLIYFRSQNDGFPLFFLSLEGEIETDRLISKRKKNLLGLEEKQNRDES